MARPEEILLIPEEILLIFDEVSTSLRDALVIDEAIAPLIGFSLLASHQEDDVHLDRPIESALDSVLNRNPSRAIDVALFGMARVRDFQMLSLFLLTLVRAGSAKDGLYGDLFLATVILQEQAAGRIPPFPFGLYLRRSPRNKIATTLT